MNIIKKLTWKSIKKNKKRTVGTIMGIIMSVALVCAVGGMFSSFQATLVENAISDTGYYHIELININEKKLEEVKLNKDIEKIMTMKVLGYSAFENSLEEDEFPYIKVYSMSNDDFNDLKYKLVKGNFPQNNNEIVLSEKVLKRSNYKVGDEIVLNVGKLYTADSKESNERNWSIEDEEFIDNPIYKKFKIVGVVSKFSKNHLLYGMTTEEEGSDTSAYLELKNPNNYKDTITNLLEVKSYKDISKSDIDFNLNSELLRWETLNFSPSTVTMLTTVFSVVVGIIIIASVFCIRNSFAISVVEKMKMYGMLASVGATKKQIKKGVLYEGIILGLIGIPIGVLCGMLAVYCLIKIVNLLIGEIMFAGMDGMVFSIHPISILLAVTLGFITIYLSSITSAIKASRVSPIENLKSSQQIKMKAKKLKTPKWISAIFKTGGELAYKNLKRSKKKYRTTVISLTVSIFIFISMNAFISEAFKQSNLYYVDYDYNIIIRDNFNDANIGDIRSLDHVDEMYVLYKYKNYTMNIFDMSKVNQYEDESRKFVEDANMRKYASLSLVGLDDETFKNYASKIGVSYDDCKDKAILYDTFYYESVKDGNSKYKRRYKYQKGDEINAESSTDKFNFTVGSITDIAPFGYENSYYEDGILVINQKYSNQVELEMSSILIQSSEADKVVSKINQLNSDLNVINCDAEAKAQRGYVIVISIFLYGFITVISLIGVTNIFNTITSNMELRSREFAILKSIGMTKKEFNRMINLETLFYSTKALVYGIILGLIGTVLIHKGFGVKNEMILEVPYTAIMISILFVFIIVSIIMKYSIKKINSQNTIETIRNENI